MIAKVQSIVPLGFGGALVDVEGDKNQGLPAFNIVGMGSRTVSEARERVKSALHSSGFSFPLQKITINLAPADLNKDGTYLDLPITLSVMVLSGQLRQQDVEGKAFVGELSLEGTLRPVRGIVNIIEKAKELGLAEIYVPVANYAQATLVSGVSVTPVESLKQLFLHLKGQQPITPPASVVKNTDTEVDTPSGLWNQIRGQEIARRALLLAISGHHNLLLSGPPGAGKTMLARAAHSLLPPLSAAEQIAVTKLYSLAGLSSQIITSRPFRTPHHTASVAALVGGGKDALPGEISLAHHGVLFLDELPEYPRNSLEALRQPLEDKQITIARANTRTCYPADFILLATMNPCPCGHLGDPTHLCTCTDTQIQAYHKRISGPLLDRIDLQLKVKRVKTTQLGAAAPLNPSLAESVVKNTITEVITLQRRRYQSDVLYNGNLPSSQVLKLLRLSDRAKSLLDSASERLGLSARSYFKVIRVAQTIADWEAASVNAAETVASGVSSAAPTGPVSSSTPVIPIQPQHITEALTYR